MVLWLYFIYVVVYFLFSDKNYEKMINWKQFPFLRLLIPFMLGIILSLYFDYEIVELPYVLGIYLIGLITWSIRPFFNQRFSFGYLSQFFILFFGYQLTIQFHAERCLNYLITERNSPTFFTGIVVETPQQKKWLKVRVELENAGTDLDSLQSGCGILLTYIEADSQSTAITYGDKIVFKGYPQRIDPPKNPAAFDTQTFYFKENIHHQIFIKKENWQLLASNQGNLFYATILNWRLHFIEILREYLPKATDFSVASALILGYKNEMVSEVREAYQTTGATHVLAVSGLHVGLVVWLLLHFFNRFRSYHPAWLMMKFIILISLILLFVLITGAPPSVRRAAILFSLVLVGKDFLRRYDSLNLLAVSAYGLLLFNPYLMLDVGFQLSYLAMGGILYFQPRIYPLLYFKSNLADRVWQLLTVSIAAQLMTLPISIYYFHQIPIYSCLSSLVVVPAAAFILGLGFLLFFTAAISTTLATWVGMTLGFLISVVNWCIFLIESIPHNLITGLWWSGSVIVLIYFIIFSMTVAVNNRQASFKWLQIGLMAFVFIGANFAHRQFKIHQQRQIVIYHTPRHSLIDCIDQRQIFTLHSDSLSEQMIDFNARNYHQFAQVQAVTNISFAETQPVAQAAFSYQPHQFQFYDQQIIIVDRPLKKQVSECLKTDYVLIINSPKIKLAEVVEHFEFRQLIFDASNPFWRVKQWQKECKELNLDCYDINEKGAWIKNIEFNYKNYE